ncbi:MAG: hypothetical protein GEV06_12410 [Luteitalea sp.]|nr:hypothetical protein [Luteitalea sp.]
MVKATFTLDDETMQTIRAIAERKKKAQSLVVREAIAVYASREEKLSDEERARKLRVIDNLMSRAPTRPQAEVDEELREIRRGRRLGWRRPAE